MLTVPVATWGPLIEGWRPTGPQPVEDEPLEVQVELAEDIINPFKNFEYSAEESAEKQKEEVQQPAEADAEVEPAEVAPPQEVLEADPPEVVCNQEDVDKMKFKERVVDLQDFQVRHLTLSTPLASRREGHVIQATAELYARYRSLQLPIKRVHTDRAKEFMGKGFQRWVANRGLQATWTAGDEPTGNGRAEVEIQNTKNRVRLLLQSAGLGEDRWPVAVRQASESRFRKQLAGMGLKLPALIPLGTKVLVKTKLWHLRGQPWKMPFQSAMALGPAAGMSPTSHGYWVELDSGQGLRTTVVVKPKFSGTVKDGIQAMNRGQDPGDAVHEEFDRLLREDDYSPSVAPAPARVEDVVEVPDDEYDGPVRDGPAEHDPPRWRVFGKQPPAASEGPAGRGEMVNVENENGEGEGQPAIIRCLALVDGSSLQSYESCDVCGLRQLQECDACQFCGEHLGRGERQVLNELEEETNIQKVCSHVEKGIQDFVLDEVLVQLDVGGDPSYMAFLAELNDQVEELRDREERAREKIGACLRSLQADGEVQSEPEVLQTYVVSNAEVKADAELWKPVIMDEIVSLESTETIEPLTGDQVNQLEGEVEHIPGKLICSRKAPDGRRKARIVGCGNYSSVAATVETSTGGLDAVSLRVLVALASQERWTIGTTDVKSAFLQAPRRAAAHRTTLVRPPGLAVALGLIGEDVRWRVIGALYGLSESPGDWTSHRNGELRTTTWKRGNHVMSFKQSAESNIWQLMQDGERVAFLGTYVDDLIAVGPDEFVREMLGQIGRIWKCTEPEILSGPGSLRFCGFEVVRTEKGYVLHQRSYLKEMLAKYEVTKGCIGVPAPAKLVEGEDEKVEMGSLREAQAIIGELHWLTTRTRVDVAFHVGLCSRLMHRKPQWIGDCATTKRKSKTALVALKANFDSRDR